MGATGETVIATRENFASAVLDASSAAPVLVDFWAPWCGPCRALTPMLDRIAADYGGRFVLATVNTDEQQELASHFGIRSIPTVMLFRDGQPVDQFVGVQPEQTIRQMLDRHLPDTSAGPVEKARELQRRGDGSGAVTMLEQALAEKPESAELLAELATLQLERGRQTEAEALVERLGAVAPEHESLKALLARVEFAGVVSAQPDATALRETLQRDPGDSAARHALAAHHAVAGDYATALAEWLELMRRDRKFGDDVGRRSLLKVFDVLGADHELVGAYRRRMAALLH
jgi:putative thioredoxin